MNDKPRAAARTSGSDECCGRRNPAAGVLRIPHEETLVFLTVNAVRPADWLATEEAHRCLVETWREARGWLVGFYLLMPDHLHCLCAPGHGNFGLERWLSYWKDQFRKRHRNADWKWQSRGFHHRLRRSEGVTEVWRYVRQNPVRAGLVSSPQSWSWQGVVHDLGIAEVDRLLETGRNEASCES